ncbi:MAG: DUF3592 domain-containing protein [Chloroflexi bacterium]|nr:DUF3592 domain-containing protein [Chloroflexota bacterium]
MNRLVNGILKSIAVILGFITIAVSYILPAALAEITKNYFLYLLWAPVLNVALVGLLVLRGMQSRSWPTVEGKILLSQALQKENDSGYGETFYYPVMLRYEYAVEDKRYESTRLHFGKHWYDSWSSAQKAIAKYPKGACIVHYNARKPGLSTLEPGVKVGFWFALLLLVVGLFYVLIQEDDRSLLIHLY